MMSVTIAKDGPVTIVTIDRPAKRNAVDPATADMLRDAFTAFATDKDAKVAILTGSSDHFCAGFDLGAVGTSRYDPDGPGPMGPTRMLLEKPVIAAVEGHAVAGGLELALWCDLRVAAQSAVFGVYCRRWGVPLIDGGTVRLPRIVGQGRALDMILTGRAVDAAEAQRIGLADRVVADGDGVMGSVDNCPTVANADQRNHDGDPRGDECDRCPHLDTGAADPDTDGDGIYEVSTFAENLNAPYGLALVGDKLYVANQDAVVRFDYQPGQTKASGPPQEVALLPSEINHHWTKALAASADGRYLYVGIGSNSNITERGMAAEVDRARIWRINASTGEYKTYATGLRNPTALAIEPDTGQLWAVVNERDEIGPDLVPDYLTAVREGAFYGWPYSYWGQNIDVRVRPQDPAKVATAIKPDYSLGAHVAALGVDFSTDAMGRRFANGVFVGEHGSWNRSEPVGYKVVFVPFRDGRPSGPPVDFVTGFRDNDGTTRGRPVGVTVDPKGALIVADDLSNTIWRVTPVPTAQSSRSVPNAQSE